MRTWDSRVSLCRAGLTQAELDVIAPASRQDTRSARPRAGTRPASGLARQPGHDATLESRSLPRERWAR